MPEQQLIQVFEYSTLRIGEHYTNKYDEEAYEYTQDFHDLLVSFNQEATTSYYTIDRYKVKFNHYVGIIQIGNLVIEILPKIDHITDDKRLWRDVLLKMLKYTGEFNIHFNNNAHVSSQKIHLLELFFDAFLIEVEEVVNKGLVKKYEKLSGNRKSLKGRIKFDEHEKRNIVNKARFYTESNTYTLAHHLNILLVKGIRVVYEKSKHKDIRLKCKRLLLNFPDFSNKAVSQANFDILKFNRNNEHYKEAIRLARIIIFNLGPDVKKGKEEMVAILFNMFDLWEKFVYRMLRKQEAFYPGLTVTLGEKKDIWGSNVLKSDIIIRRADKTYILDTKWKILGKNKTPNSQDIRQIYTYCKFWNSSKGALVYPSHETSDFVFTDYTNEYDAVKIQATVGEISVFKDNTNLYFDERFGRNILEKIGVIRENE